VVLNFKPTFRVTADGNDISGLLGSRLSSIEVVDRAGIESDSCTITLADPGPFKLALPRTGAVLEVSLGYFPTATSLGKFIVDEITVSGPPDQMIITGRASPHEETTDGQTDLQTQKTRSFPDGTTLGDLVETLAGEHGLEPAIADDLAAIVPPHIDQLNESDMSLLTRIAANYGAIAKPAGGRLAVVRRGEGRSASGQELPTITLTPGQVSSWSATIARREVAKTVVAVYRDFDGAEDVEVEVGEGEPIRRMRHTFPDEDSARDAAEAELARSEREGGRVTVTLPGRVDLMAEGKLVLAGFREGVAGEWTIEGVTHRLDGGGYSCTVDAEQPDDEG
jgi:phage protein D